jgi:hypothetical protein
MAQKKATGGGVKAPQVSPLVEELTQGGTEVPNVSVLVGYVGNASEEGRVRLYLTADLSNFVEFSLDDMVCSEVLQEGGAGATAVWIRKGARLTHTQTLSREVQAEFLSGGIAEAFGGGFSAASQNIITNNGTNIMAMAGNNTGLAWTITAARNGTNLLDITGNNGTNLPAITGNNGTNLPLAFGGGMNAQITPVTITMTYVAGVTQGPRCGGQ